MEYSLKFFGAAEKLVATELLVFLSSEKHLMRNLAFVIRWKQLLIPNSLFKIRLTEKQILVFHSSSSSLLAFFSTGFFLFCNIWCFKLAFLVVLEKISFIFCEFSHYKVFVADFFFNVSVTIRLSITRVLDITWYTSCIVQKMNFSIKDFLSKCDQILRKLQIWSHLLKKSLIKIFIFCAVLNIATNSI